MIKNIISAIVHWYGRPCTTTVCEEEEKKEREKKDKISIDVQYPVRVRSFCSEAMKHNTRTLTGDSRGPICVQKGGELATIAYLGDMLRADFRPALALTSTVVLVDSLLGLCHRKNFLCQHAS